MTIEIGIAIEIAIENGAIGKRFDNDPDPDLESPRLSVLHRTQNLTHLQRFFSLKDPGEALPQTDES